MIQLNAAFPGNNGNGRVPILDLEVWHGWSGIKMVYSSSSSDSSSSSSDNVLFFREVYEESICDDDELCSSSTD